MMKKEEQNNPQELKKRNRLSDEEETDSSLESEGSATAFNETEEVRDGESEFDNTLHEK